MKFTEELKNSRGDTPARTGVIFLYEVGKSTDKSERQVKGAEYYQRLGFTDDKAMELASWNHK